MHVLLATPAFLPFVGGAERHTGVLARQLVSRGHRVTVLTSSATKEPDFWLGCGQGLIVESPEQGLKVIRVPIRPFPGGLRGLLAWRKSMVVLSSLPGTLGTLQMMARLVPPLTKPNEALGNVTGEVDIVHGFNISWEHAMMVAAGYARDNRIPFVASPLAHFGRGPRDPVALNSTMRHQLQLLSAADLWLTNTADEARQLRARGMSEARFRVAGPGVDIPDSEAPLLEIDATLKPYVLFVGRTSNDKGAKHAAQAVLKLREQGVDVNLVLIGLETDEFRRFYARLSAGDQQAIRFLGFADELAKHAYLEQAEALVLPSRSDSFGIVLLESWYHRRPVIAARAGGIPDVVDHGENGILVPFADVPALAAAIRQLLEDPALNRALGERGRQKLEAHYTWDVITDRVIDAYNEAIDSYRPGLQLA
jgi:glycogen(starch) synthase